MVKKEEYYLESYSGTYKELMEVKNSYVGTTAQFLWESRREKNAVLLIRWKLEEVADKFVKIGEGYPATKEEIKRAIELSNQKD